MGIFLHHTWHRELAKTACKYFKKQRNTFNCDDATKHWMWFMTGSFSSQWKKNINGLLCTCCSLYVVSIHLSAAVGCSIIQVFGSVILFHRQHVFFFLCTELQLKPSVVSGSFQRKIPVLKLKLNLCHKSQRWRFYGLRDRIYFPNGLNILLWANLTQTTAALVSFITAFFKLLPTFLLHMWLTLNSLKVTFSCKVLHTLLTLKSHCQMQMVHWQSR